METPENRNDQLAEDLRALRPTPHPQFAAELDKRAAAGFPRRSRPRRLSFSLPRRPSRRLLLPAGGLAVIAIVGVLVTTNESEQEPANGAAVLGLLNAESSPEDAPEAAGGAAGEPAPQIENYQGATEAAAAGNAASPLSFAGQGRPNRAVERNAELVLGADPADVADDSSKVFEAVHAHDGIVMSSSTREGEPGVAGARFVLLIPSAKLSDALAALSGVDEVRTRHEATDDITAPTVQTGELLQDSKARIDSLLAQLEATETESEREAVEGELAAERRHRARLRSQLQNLERRADYSRVLVRIETGGTHDSSGGAWGVDDALGDAGHILAIAAAIAVVSLAILGPIALIALLAWLTHRAWLRRERRRVLG
ncbi:MAG TPA: DUF4349 domain-containing protein [Solirubrobacterales bacterium]|nr:DUF4349 domain-containing protein [Solirubrobacterales bacterium]